MSTFDRRRNTHHAEVHRFLFEEAMTCVFQAIVDVGSKTIVGVEALTRFDDVARRPPDFWFREAMRVGLGVALEAVVLKKQLAMLPRLPNDAYLSVNVSPETLMSGTLPTVLADHPLERVVIELTEQTLISDYMPLERVLAPLRARGIRLAVDDAGAGYATFRHILKLSPDIIKLDISLTRGVESDRAKRALASALYCFGREMEVGIIPEGVETQAELQVLQELGGRVMQGFLLHRPSPIEELILHPERVASPG